MPTAAVITVSDRCYLGERADLSGPEIEKILQAEGYTLLNAVLVPDEHEQIEAALCRLADLNHAALIVTTGGTGFALRDVTPEATLAVCDRMAPGLAEAMRAKSLLITPHAMLSRAVAGMRGRTLIVNLPGSPKAARENLEVLLPALPHALMLLAGEKPDA
ncbi:MAG: MogA/MoaB family molybdenum cofactor biosynthesis protein [Clostridia bacterium]